MSKRNKEDFMGEIDLDRYEEEQQTWAVSFADLVKQDLYKDWSKSGRIVDGTISEIGIQSNNSFSISYYRPSQNELEFMLSEVGLDVVNNYEEQVNSHRTWDGCIVHTTRWTGTQRTDSKWLKFLKELGA